jgi:hypothetical protein
MWYTRSAHRVLTAKPKQGENFENLNVDGIIILDWILRKQDGRTRSGFFWIRVGVSGWIL